MYQHFPSFPQFPDSTVQPLLYRLTLALRLKTYDLQGCKDDQFFSTFKSILIKHASVGFPQIPAKNWNPDQFHSIPYLYRDNSSTIPVKFHNASGTIPEHFQNSIYSSHIPCYAVLVPCIFQIDSRFSGRLKRFPDLP